MTAVVPDTVQSQDLHLRVPREVRLRRLSNRAWPKRHDDDCRSGVVLLQHRVTGRLGRAPGTSGRWSCPCCGGEKAQRVWFNFTEQAGERMWWGWAPLEKGLRDRIKKRAARAGARYLLVRRTSSLHVFSDMDLSGDMAPTSGRFLTPEETGLVARFALRVPGVRWTSVREYVLAKPVSPWRMLDYTSYGNSITAQERAEAALAERHGRHIDLERALPPELMEEAGEEVIKQLAALRDDPWGAEGDED